nr:hypothetical protein Itr_chr06CG01130 [Ipomoea trifida]GMD11105.1 hypothetical protein Iba_chr06fCG1150 [Ipomoea batatas]
MPLSIKVTTAHLQHYYSISFNIHKSSMSALVDIWTMEAAKQHEKAADKATTQVEPRGYAAGWSWSPKLRQFKVVNYSDASLFMLLHCFSP